MVSCWCPCVRQSICLPVPTSFYRTSSVFSFPDDNLSKWQLIFTKLSMCIDIVKIWFEISNG